MKKLTVFALLLIILSFSVVPVSAGDDSLRLVDDGDLFTESQEEVISQRLKEVSNEKQHGIAIVTADGIVGIPLENYARMVFKANDFGMGEDGRAIMLIVDEKTRQYYIYYTDTDDDLPGSDIMSEYFLSDFSNDDFYEGCLAFIDGVESELSFPLFRNILISLFVALVIALIVVTSMKSKLKTVRNVNHAREYVRRDSFVLEKSRDLYLYSTVTRVPKPKPNNSSGGRGGFGGGGGGRSGGGRF